MIDKLLSTMLSWPWSWFFTDFVFGAYVTEGMWWLTMNFRLLTCWGTWAHNGQNQSMYLSNYWWSINWSTGLLVRRCLLHKRLPRLQELCATKYKINSVVQILQSYCPHHSLYEELMVVIRMSNYGCQKSKNMLAVVSQFNKHYWFAMNMDISSYNRHHIKKSIMVTYLVKRT